MERETEYLPIYCVDVLKKIRNTRRNKGQVVPLTPILTSMRHCFIALALATVVGTKAQITITSADMPSVGDTLRVSIAQGTNNVDHTLSGTNYLWDFSALTPIAQDLYKFNAPTAIPFNFLATYGLLNPSPDSIPFLGVLPNNFTDYFKNSSSGYRQVGSSFEYAPLGNFTVPILYSAADYVYNFPLALNDIDTSISEFSFGIPGTFYLKEWRTRVNTVDGWGTLITPFGTFQSLRVRSVIEARDSISLDSTGNNSFVINRPTAIEYKWLVNGGGVPYLQVDATIAGNMEIVNTVTYRDSMRDNVFQVGVGDDLSNSSEIYLFPNPTTHTLYVATTLPNGTDATIRITDAAGRVLYSEGHINLINGVMSVDCSTLSAGVYFIHVLSKNQIVATSRFVRN